MATLILVGFKKDLYRAAKVLNELVDRGYDWTTELEDAVAAYRDYNGKLNKDSNFQITTGEDAALDGLLGSLVGLTLGAIAGPITTGTDADVDASTITAGTRGGGAHSAASGALDAKWWKVDFCISDDFVNDAGALVQPGDSAIYGLLRTADPTIVAAMFRDYGGVVLFTTFSPEQAKKTQDVLSGKNKFRESETSRPS